MKLEWFDPRKFNLFIGGRNGQFEFDVNWPVAFPFVAVGAIGFFLGWLL